MTENRDLDTRRIRHADLVLTNSLLTGLRYYQHNPGADAGFAAAVETGLTLPELPDGTCDWDRYPPAGHDFPGVGS